MDGGLHPLQLVHQILAEQAYDEKQAAKIEEKLRKNRFTLQDYYELDGLARGSPDGQGRAAPGVAVQLGEDDAVTKSRPPKSRRSCGKTALPFRTTTTSSSS